MIRHCTLFLCFFIFTTGVLVPVQANAQKKNTHKIYHMPPGKIADYIKQKKGQRKVVVRYASWCPACRNVMPKLMDIERVKKGSVIAIATDEHHGEFARYINRFGRIPFPVILVRPFKNESLTSALSQFGIVNRGYIPDMALLDEENKIVRQGSFKAEEVAAFIFQREEKK